MFSLFSAAFDVPGIKDVVSNITDLEEEPLGKNLKKFSLQTGLTRGDIGVDELEKKMVRLCADCIHSNILSNMRKQQMKPDLSNQTKHKKIIGCRIVPTFIR